MLKNASAIWPDVKPLVQQHDCLLLDLDGTLFRGHEPTEGSVGTLNGIDARVLYVTNNASRAAGDVAAHLSELGFTAGPDDVVTSAQTAARLLADQLPPRSRVLVVGTAALAAEVAAVGLLPVRLFEDNPAAVVQGHSTTTAWADLAEAALTIRAGGLWMAANVDRTLPTERGLLPGNGSMVAALQAATDAEPQVAGKPAPALMADALSRGDFRAPLVVGDRLDTDIAGANAADLPSLLVLTGVSTAMDAIQAEPRERPSYLAADLRGLLADVETLRIAAHPAWHVDHDGAAIIVYSTGDDPGDDGLSVVRASARAVWDAGGHQRGLTLTAGDDVARAALERWSLLTGADRLA